MRREITKIFSSFSTSAKGHLFTMQATCATTNNYRSLEFHKTARIRLSGHLNLWLELVKSTRSCENNDKLWNIVTTTTTGSTAGGEWFFANCHSSDPKKSSTKAETFGLQENFVWNLNVKQFAKIDKNIWKMSYIIPLRLQKRIGSLHLCDHLRQTSRHHSILPA